MKKICILIFMSMAMLAPGCKHPVAGNNYNAFKSISRSFAQSNQYMGQQCSTIEKNFANDTAASLYSHAAKLWQPKALYIKTRSTEMVAYLDQLKIELKKSAGLRLVDMREQWDEDDVKSVEAVFFTMKKGDELAARLYNYEIDVLQTDKNLDAIFRDIFDTMVFPQLPGVDKPLNFSEFYFKNISAGLAFALLQKLENDVRHLEVQLMTYCYLQVPR